MKIKREMFVVIIGLLFVVSFFYYVNLVTTPPRSYAWDLGFEEAEYDEAFKMYVKEESRDFRGEYLLRIWVEAPENNTVQVHLLQGFDRPWGSGGLRTREVEKQFGIRTTWTFRNDKVYWSGESQPQGSEVDSEWDLYNPYRFRACSQSRDAVVHIRIEFLRTDLNWPWGRTHG